jgi:signal transduction histidine kinase/CheY-like chemotaxis protein/HPt (histidine-containing phosphotransfer) domain-containing protein
VTADDSTSSRWPRNLAVLGAFVALAAAGLQLYGADGPWAMISAGAAGLALIGSLWPNSHADKSNDRAHRPAAGESYQQLVAEIEKHKQLERELITAKQAAEAATMSKGEFLATMSHEIRTPLNGIIPLLDILLSAPLAPDHREYVQTAFGSAKQLLRIVDDILDYSKLEANKLELESVGVNLKDVLESVQRLMDKSAESKNLRLSLNIDPGVRLAVRGDPVRLRQILTNLLSNAIKFTERGSVTLNVTRRGETRTQHEMRFEVKDTGVGIAPDVAEKLFQPFSQADASTTRTYGGTGLGLVICKRIVDLMGGQIGVESQPGRGSLFWFQVPMLKAHGDIGARRRELNGARVLVVTSNPSQQRRLAHALPAWGAMAVNAANTQEALAKLRAAAGRSSSWSFDMMLVDAGAIPTTLLALHRSVLRENALEDLQIVYLRGDEDVPGEIVEGERVRIVQRDAGDVELRQQLSRMLESDGRSGLAPSAPSVTVIAPAANARVPALAPDAPLRGHVLLVEDNPVNRQVAQRLLALAGLTLDSAENGREALDRLNAGAYDAVLMDCQMPVMDGYTATRQRRAQEAEQGLEPIPIIAMTANAMVGDREKCLSVGMDDYLSKPLNRALLEETLRRWMPAIPAAEKNAQAAPAMPARAEPMRAELAAAASAGAPARSPGFATPAAPPALVRAASRETLPREAAPRETTARDEITLPRFASIPVARPAAAAPPPPAPVAPVAPPAPRTEPVSSAPVLNREIVDDLREIMGEEFVALVKVFLEDAPHALEKLDAAAARHDIDALVGPAHSLKSTSANLGALALSDLARTIEHGARQRTLADPQGTVAALGREFRRVDTALRGFLG